MVESQKRTAVFRATPATPAESRLPRVSLLAFGLLRYKPRQFATSEFVSRLVSTFSPDSVLTNPVRGAGLSTGVNYRSA